MTTLNSNALTLLVTAKDHLDVAPSNTDYDNRICRMINQASELIASHCGRVLVDSTHTEYYDGRRTNKLTLHQYPVTGGAATGGKPEVFLGSSGSFDRRKIKKWLVYRSSFGFRRTKEKTGRKIR